MLTDVAWILLSTRSHILFVTWISHTWTLSTCYPVFSSLLSSCWLMILKDVLQKLLSGNSAMPTLRSRILCQMSQEPYLILQRCVNTALYSQPFFVVSKSLPPYHCPHHDIKSFLLGFLQGDWKSSRNSSSNSRTVIGDSNDPLEIFGRSHTHRTRFQQCCSQANVAAQHGCRSKASDCKALQCWPPRQ